MSQIGGMRNWRDGEKRVNAQNYETMTDPTASKLIEVSLSPLSEAYTYLPPQDIIAELQIGLRVEVPLGRRFASGFITRLLSHNEQHEDFQIKAIQKVLHPTPCFDEESLRFYQWIAEYYCVPLSRVLETAIPEPLPIKTQKHWFSTPAQDEPKGLKQREILKLIRERGEKGISHFELQQRFPNSSASLRRLTDLALISREDRTESASQFLTYPEQSLDCIPSVVLNAQQTSALDAISNSLSVQSYQGFLLHGVTGSGKTEVYIEAAQQVLATGGSILVLVPEIALTPQLVDRFRARLREPIAVMHSSLPKRQRWECWRAIAEGTCRVALGVRSSVFAPLKKLSLIIVDEEHDSSYKQGDGFRYNARDLALVRGKLTGATTILGSATPSVESFYNASLSKIGYLRLKERPYKNEQHSYEIVNLSRIKKGEMASESISPQLFSAIQETLIRGEQVFLLYNRRGFARYLQCDTCGESVFCPNCSVPLTYHQVGHKLLCHYCSHTTQQPRECQHCVNRTDLEEEPILRLRGSGTQKLLEELEALFPHASIARLDRDSADKLADLQSILQGVRDHSIQILAGTQMIAKGHDLPGVTLVGVIDCDVGLHMPDFRAAERVFQLLTQAGGRAGRRELPGRVILQTRLPQHSSIALTTEEDYHSFAKRELTLRQKLHYPPFRKLARIICSATEEKIPVEQLHIMKSMIHTWCEAQGVGVECLGPSPAPIEKVKALYRAHLLLRSEKSSDLRKVVAILKMHIKMPANVRLTYDIDPQDML
jgi:primosomal protein N' (replication factor Y)